VKKFAWTVLFMLSFVTIAFAVDQATAAPGGWESWRGLVKGVGAGILAGLSVAYLGFLKDRDPQKKWDPKQAAVTLVIAAVVGAVAGFEKKDLTKPEDWYQAGTAVLLAELLGKAAWRTGGPVIGGFVQSVIGKKSE